MCKLSLSDTLTIFLVGKDKYIGISTTLVNIFSDHELVHSTMIKSDDDIATPTIILFVLLIDTEIIVDYIILCTDRKLNTTDKKDSIMNINIESSVSAKSQSIYKDGNINPSHTLCFKFDLSFNLHRNWHQWTILEYKIPNIMTNRITVLESMVSLQISQDYYVWYNLDNFTYHTNEQLLELEYVLSSVYGTAISDFSQVISNELICGHSGLYNINFNSNLRYLLKYTNEAIYTAHKTCILILSYNKSEYVIRYITINGHTHNTNTSSKEFLYKIMIENGKLAVVTQFSTNIIIHMQGIIGYGDFKILNSHCKSKDNYDSFHRNETFIVYSLIVYDNVTNLTNITWIC